MIDSLREYTESLTDIDNKLLNCRDDFPEIRDELIRSKKIFEQQAEDLTRKIAWITINVFSHVIEWFFFVSYGIVQFRNSF